MPELRDDAEVQVVHIRPRVIVLSVATVTLTLLAMRILASAGRVLGWIAMAAAIAAVLTPSVNVLARRVPRGLAVVLVAILTIASVGFVAYGLVGDIVDQTRVLRAEAPRLAQRLEREGRFASTFSEANLSDRVRRVVDEVPERLRGGSPAEAVRSATTRGLAFLAVSVLTIFFILHGGRILRGAAEQIHDDDKRADAERVASAVARRALTYARGTMLMAGLAGAFAYVVARATGVPGAAPLAVWVAMWDVLPLAGTALGALPIVALGAFIDPRKGLLLAALFIGWQLFEYVAMQRPLDRRSVRVGPFLTALAGFAGVELYGVAGGLLAIFAVTIAVVVVEEVALGDERVPLAHGDE